MPRKSKQTAHAELDELRQQAAGERVKARDVAAQLEAAKAKVVQASASITAGYAAGDERAVAQARKAEEQAVAPVRELQHRVDGAALRVERAQQQLDEYQGAHARDLLAEREQPARTVALELSRAVAEALRLHRAYLTEHQTMDQLVAAVPGATPRADGPELSHPWEPALGQLARAYQQTPQLEPPLPRWQGLEQRTAQNSSARRLQLQRRKRLTPDEESELATITAHWGSLPRESRSPEMYKLRPAGLSVVVTAQVRRLLPGGGPSAPFTNDTLGMLPANRHDAPTPPPSSTRNKVFRGWKGPSWAWLCGVMCEGRLSGVRTCVKCGKTAGFDAFPPDRGMRDGQSSWCRECHNAATREWRELNPEKAASYNLARRVVHEPRRRVECAANRSPRGVPMRNICSDLYRWRRSRRRRKAA